MVSGPRRGRGSGRAVGGTFAGTWTHRHRLASGWLPSPARRGWRAPPAPGLLLTPPPGLLTTAHCWSLLVALVKVLCELWLQEMEAAASVTTQQEPSPRTTLTNVSVKNPLSHHEAHLPTKRLWGSWAHGHTGAPCGRPPATPAPASHPHSAPCPARCCRRDRDHVPRVPRTQRVGKGQGAQTRSDNQPAATGADAQGLRTRCLTVGAHALGCHRSSLVLMNGSEQGPP